MHIMYRSIGGKIKEFALPSMYNFTFSFLKELQNEDFKEFKERRLKYYSSINKKTLTFSDENKQFLFEQFFFGYKLMNNIKLISDLEPDKRIPLIQLTTMAFYYSAYSFANIFLFCQNKNILITHSKTYKEFDKFCNRLSFPFNLKGRFKDGSLSDFELINGKGEYKGFTYDSQALRRKDLDGFDYKSAIYSYLKGTHKWYWKNSNQLKQALKELKIKEYADFRKKDAKTIREKHYITLPNANFLSCLYRIRGKVNYRDSIFSLYDLNPGDNFNYYEKAVKLPNIMLEILKYFSVDIESFFIIRYGNDTFHKAMLSDMLNKTSRYRIEFPKFQMELFYES